MRTRMVWAVVALAAAATARAQQEQGQQGGGTEQQAGGAPRQDAGGSGRAQSRAAPARAQQAQAGGEQVAIGPTSDAFDRACVDLLHGRMPQGEKAIKSLRDACANLMSGRVDERLDAAHRRQQQLQAQEQLRAMARGEVQPGQSAAQPQQGQGVLAAFGQAGSELTGGGRQGRALGMRARGPVSYLLVTNPVGWFTGLGINAELFGAVQDMPKVSWVVGARYAATDATNGTASTFGAEFGADYFIIGQHDEGLRLGPRVELAAGREHFLSNTSFARLGIGGEVGYNFVASNGISGMAAVGLGGRVAGNSKNDNFSSFVGGEFGPYAKVGIGFGW